MRRLVVLAALLVALSAGAAEPVLTRAAAEQGNARAQTTLGLAYLDGDGVPKDAAKMFPGTRSRHTRG